MKEITGSDPEYLKQFRVVLQAIADGEVDQPGYSQIKVKIPNRFLIGSLKAAVRQHQIDVAHFKDIVPKNPLSKEDKKFIQQVYKGNGPADIMRETGWFLEEVNKYRKRVLLSLGLVCEPQIVIWYELRDKRKKS
jgi:hypothetical protein